MWEAAIAAAVATVASTPNSCRRPTSAKAAQTSCEGCGAADFSAFACSYCRRPVLDPSQLAQVDATVRLHTLYGAANLRPELVLAVK